MRKYVRCISGCIVFLFFFPISQIGGLLSDFIVCNSDNSRWLLSFLLDKILFNASVWSSEEKLTRCSMKMLSKLCQSNSTRFGFAVLFFYFIITIFFRSAYFCNTEKLWLFMKDCASGRHLSVTVCSPSVQKDIFLGLFSCACGDLKDRFVKEVRFVLLVWYHHLHRVVWQSLVFQCDFIPKIIFKIHMKFLYLA